MEAHVIGHMGHPLVLTLACPLPLPHGEPPATAFQTASLGDLPPQTYSLCSPYIYWQARGWSLMEKPLVFTFVCSKSRQIDWILAFVFISTLFLANAYTFPKNEAAIMAACLSIEMDKLLANQSKSVLTPTTIFYNISSFYSNKVQNILITTYSWVFVTPKIMRK